MSNFEIDVLANPGQTLENLSKLIMERGVKREVGAVRDELRREMQGYVQQVSGTLGTTIVDKYKNDNLNTAQGRTVAPLFDSLIAEATKTDPSVIYNPVALNNLKTLAIGQAFEKGMLSGSPRIFSEQPGGVFNGLRGEPVAPEGVSFIAQKLGIEPKQAEALHQAMLKAGVYRD